MAVANRKLHIKTGDTVEIISGKDKGKRGKVLRTIPREGKIIVENINMLTVHTKPRGMNQPGGIIHREGPIHASKAMPVCKSCNKKTRVGKQILEDGSKMRVCKVCGETFND
ncbi:MAG: 50S ribosomal protein L24 [Clostridiales bacterium]|nr:50S ribosomal protein L24 [Clostridiales bacterium]